jgi:uncharacterized membrane protein
MNADDPRSRTAVRLAAALALAFVAGTVVAPLLTAAGHAAGPWLHVLYSPLCHQMPERSLSAAGVPQPVCARCEGLYAGGVLGLLAALVLVVGPARGRVPIHAAWLLVAATPTAVDFALPWVGLPGLTNVPRLLLAVPAGFTAALFLSIGIADLFQRRPVPTPAEVLDA